METVTTCKVCASCHTELVWNIHRVSYNVEGFGFHCVRLATCANPLCQMRYLCRVFRPLVSTGPFSERMMYLRYYAQDWAKAQETFGVDIALEEMADMIATMAFAGRSWTYVFRGERDWTPMLAWNREETL